jgi:predicted TIM-barrel fold metal-dependent hydrolase
MGRIIDTHVHIYDEVEPAWAFPAYPAETMIQYMDGPYTVAGTPRRVDRALVMPTPGITIQPGLTFREQHETVIQAARKYPERVAGNFMFNPHLGIEAGIAEMERLVKEEGFRAVKLHPTFHCYFPHKAQQFTWPILEAARRLKIGVLIHTGDTPFSVPVFMAPLAEAFPDVPIVLAHYGTQKITFADEAVEVARTHENVWLETSWGQLNRVKEGIQTIGASKLIYGTDSPFHDMGIHLRTIEVLCLDPPIGLKMSEDDRERIFGGNAVDVFGL